MADDLESLRSRTKLAYKQMALAGKFKAWPEFEAMCLSPEGFEPSLGQLLLAPYLQDAAARGIIAACQTLAQRWNPVLKSIDSNRGEAAEPTIIFVKPDAAGPETWLMWARAIAQCMKDNRSGGPKPLAPQLWKIFDAVLDNDGEAGCDEAEG